MTAWTSGPSLEWYHGGQRASLLETRDPVTLSAAALGHLPVQSLHENADSSVTSTHTHHYVDPSSNKLGHTP